MDLRLNHNLADEKPGTTNVAGNNNNNNNNDDEAVSEASTDSENSNNNPGVFDTSSKQRHSSPPTAPSTSKTANPQRISPSINLSPNKGTLYARRASASSNGVPLLPSQSMRSPATYDPGNLPPPSHETNNTRFGVFKCILTYPELTLEFAKALDFEDLISIYAISKDFHYLVNARFTAMILGQATARAPESQQVFIWRCYRSVCMRDPARRINEVKPEELRFIPSFKWLRMICFREEIVDDIIHSLALEGHRLPRRASLTIKKIWFMLDIPDNKRRVTLMHNVTFWEDRDLYLATMFFLKLDMRLTHPTTGNGETGLRKLLLGQRSLSTLAKVLRREEMRTQLEMLKMIVRYSYSPRRQTCNSILGVPANEVGMLQWEGWGEKGRRAKFIGICELVMREGVRRRLGMQACWVDMMCFGYIDPKTFEDIKQKPVVEEKAEDEDSEDKSESGSGKAGGEAGGGDLRDENERSVRWE